MMFPIKELSIKVYNHRGEYIGISNLIHISKNKLRNGKEDVEGATFGVFQFKARKFKDGYKLSKNPILFK